MSTIFCMGDVHGDLLSMVAALEGNHVVDSDGVWIAGSATLIQMGDMLDAKARNIPQFHGGQDLDVLRFLKNLRHEARACGGDVRCLFGNHEIMNLAGFFMYVRDDDMEDRTQLFSSGGEGAQLVYDLCELVIIKDNILFCHAGLHPDVFEQHTASRGTLLASLMRSVVGEPIDIASHPLICAEDGITMTRYYMDAGAQDYSRVSNMLDSLGCDRMIIGHNCTSAKITSRCKGRVVLVDVGISRAFRQEPSSAMLCIESGRLWEMDHKVTSPI